MNEILNWFNQAISNLMQLVRMPYDLADAMGMLAQGLASVQVLTLMLLAAMLIFTIVRSLMGMSPVSVVGALLRALVALVFIGLPANGAFAGFSGIWYMIVAWAGWAINPHIGPVLMSSMMGCAVILCFIIGMLGLACFPGAGASKQRFNHNEPKAPAVGNTGRMM